MTATAERFRQGGDFYSPIPDPVFDLLPRKYRAVAIEVVRCLDKLLLDGMLDERATDKVIAAATGYSERSVQRALYALHRVMEGLGMQIIDRVRRNGRRIISFIRGFAARGSAPPQPPVKTSETTTTKGPSSSSVSDEGKPGEGRDIAPPELVDRACMLIPKATPGKVVDAVALYGADWVKRALDRVEKRNAKPGNKRVDSWGFVLRILENWKREGGPGPEDPQPAPPMPAKAKAEPVEAEPTRRLMPAELAELVEQCQSRNPTVARFSRVTLAKALEEGAIPAELVATIPAELLEQAKPRAP